MPACRLRFVIMSISTDELLQRNARFAAGGAYAGLSFPTNETLQVVGCVDSRVDPSDVLGLTLGEAVVMRNIGGRITRQRCARGPCFVAWARGKPPLAPW
jgi:carbonic anhydrase